MLDFTGGLAIKQRLADALAMAEADEVVAGVAQADWNYGRRRRGGA